MDLTYLAAVWLAVLQVSGKELVTSRPLATLSVGG